MFVNTIATCGGAGGWRVAVVVREERCDAVTADGTRHGRRLVLAFHTSVGHLRRRRHRVAVGGILRLGPGALRIL